MKKHEFMKELETHLRPLPPHIRRDLLEDMEQHFTFGMASGKSEEDISRELGHPVDIAIEALEEFPAAQVEGIQDETLQASTMQDWTSAPVKETPGSDSPYHHWTCTIESDDRTSRILRDLEPLALTCCHCYILSGRTAGSDRRVGHESRIPLVQVVLIPVHDRSRHTALHGS